MRRVIWFNKKRKKIADIAVGGRHVLAITEEEGKDKKAELYGWGFNFYSQLGQGEAVRDDCMTPVKITLPSTRIKKASCGYFNSIILTK